MIYKKGDKKGWTTVAARIPPDLRLKLVQKHPKAGEISDILLALIKRYMDGKIIGIHLGS